MDRRTKANIIRDRESDIECAAFAVILAIRYGKLPPSLREDLLQAHFDLSYYRAIRDNQIENICRAARQRRIAQQPGPWPEGHFDRRASEAAL